MELKVRSSISGFVEITVYEIQTNVFETKEAKSLIENLQIVIEHLEIRIEANEKQK